MLTIQSLHEELYAKSKIKDQIKIKRMTPVNPMIITNGSRKYKKIAITIDDGWVPDHA